jgi:hypothetical protein
MRLEKRFEPLPFYHNLILCRFKFSTIEMFSRRNAKSAGCSGVNVRQSLSNTLPAQLSIRSAPVGVAEMNKYN